MAAFSAAVKPFDGLLVVVVLFAWFMRISLLCKLTDDGLFFFLPFYHNVERERGQNDRRHGILMVSLTVAVAQGRSEELARRYLWFSPLKTPPPESAGGGFRQRRRQ
jgi:hypothetical protein